MLLISQILNYVLPVFYLAVVYLYCTIFFEKKIIRPKWTSLILSALGLMHLFVIISRFEGINQLPFATIFDAASFLAFSILILYLFIELKAQNQNSGLFVLAFACLLELLSAYGLKWDPSTHALLSGTLFAVHASFTILGYTALSLSAIYAFMYILQNHNMKKHRFGLLYKQLPPITYLENMSIHSVVLGIIFLGIGILIGHGQAEKVLGTFWPKDLKVIVTDVIWLFYFIGFYLTTILKWRGKWMAFLALFGFILLTVGGALTLLVTESFHKFY